MRNKELFINDYDRIFTVRLAWSIGQPFVCGLLVDVVKYALKPNNGIEYFAELSNLQLKKLKKYQLKRMLIESGHQDLCDQLFKKY